MSGQSGLCYFIFSCVMSSKLIILYRFIVLLHLISSFSLSRSLFIPFAYGSIESTDYIRLSLFEFKAILLISSVKTLRLSLLNFCCIFNMDLLFLINSL